MRAYGVDKIRSIEERAIAVEGVDPLMQRAAAAVAVSASDLLLSRTGGRYGRHVLIMVGAGNNGGDALFAGVRLARRGVPVTAVKCLGNPHPAGLAALLAAGGRLVDLDDSVLEAVGDLDCPSQSRGSCNPWRVATSRSSPSTYPLVLLRIPGRWLAQRFARHGP
jgi:hypothetical protein